MRGIEQGVDDDVISAYAGIEDSAVITRFYSLVGTLIFLVIGGDAWTLRGLDHTFTLVPLTSAPRLSSLLGGVEQSFATVFTAVGVDPRTENHTWDGRPIPLVKGGSAVEELVK